MSIPSTLGSRPLAKSYEPKEFETPVYEAWESLGCFAAQDTSQPGQASFAIMIPPPNVTGALHMGHALTVTIQDVLCRWRRMSGDNVLWMPGTDHAGIATQTQVEKWILPKTRQELGREQFLEKVWEWKNTSGNQITRQLRRVGCSLDWKRERFTMDEGFSRAVREVFIRLYEQKLIYRGDRLINWSVGAQTALSDLEVVPTERKSNLWYVDYPVVQKDGSPLADNPALTIATTRPETMLGDTAVAIHPEDERFKLFHGKYVKLPLVGKIIPIIQDDYVDREFGTGALKVTPAHDFNDYDLGKKHGLEFVTVMGKDGKITEAGGKYAGLRFNKARETIVQELTDLGLLKKIEPITHKVGLCQRTGTVVEPIISAQWFVKIDPLAKPAIAAVETGKITFTPKSWEKTYFEWMYNIRDWCISRQLWWGHRIPAWYCDQCEVISVARETPKTCQGCGTDAGHLTQDEDVLDTWFSSGLWPFATLGWPESTPALKTFYPGAILETGFDIIFFWVARMIMMGLHFMKEVPFHKVYLHALVRDEKGEKMSKSKGNVIDPLELIDAHGADPLRFTLSVMAGQGRDVKLSTDRVEGYRAFCNKLWNSVKFFHLQIEALQKIDPNFEIESMDPGVGSSFDEFSLLENRWILSRLQTVVEKVDAGLGVFALNESAQALYDFSWFELCDWYLEVSKLSFREAATAEGRVSREAAETIAVLAHTLDCVLKLLHPFIPFVTEELWQSLPQRASETKSDPTKPRVLMLQAFPKVNPALKDESSEKAFKELQQIIEAIRNFRGENGISPKVEFPIDYRVSEPAARVRIEAFGSKICSLSRIKEFRERNDGARDMEAVIPLPQLGLELLVGLKGIVNVAEETKRLQKEIDRVRSDLEHVKTKLAREDFIKKAPAALVEKENLKAREFEGKLKELAEAHQKLSRLQSPT